MDISSWFQLIVVCFLGAVSPGPSLALVMGNTLSRGRSYGVATSIGHAVGIGWWALLTAIGVAALVALNSMVMVFLQGLGACLLGYIGFRTVMARNSANSQTRVRNSVAWLRGAVEGFLISLFNPKIALFFLAIFSHLVGENPTWIDIALMSLVTAIIDGLWYVFVTLIVTTEGVGSVVQARQSSIAMISGVILMVVALYLLGTTLRSF